MKIAYLDKRFSVATLAVIERAEAICAEFAAQGFTLSLRQLYYQFVARGLIPNAQREYKRLGEIVNDARLAGLLDWRYLEDRGRNVRSAFGWDDPEQALRSVASGYHLHRWRDQRWWPEVWIEKDALVGVIAPLCRELDVSYFSCRGYTSQSEVWAAAQRLTRKSQAGQAPIILHLGDHDPSGVDMTRDITERLCLFMGEQAPQVRRLALNFDQVRQYDPPPNPAKLTDSRAQGYIMRYGGESWELDALTPQVIAALIRAELDGLIDPDAWGEVEREEAAARVLLSAVSDNWSGIRRHLEQSGLLAGGG